MKDAQTQMKRLYELFRLLDATQVEINPFVLASNGKGVCIWLCVYMCMLRVCACVSVRVFDQYFAGLYLYYLQSYELNATQTQTHANTHTSHTINAKVYCVDSKITFDDNAFFRHKDVFSLRDTTMEDPREVAASKYGLNYIGLDGEIGCMGICVCVCVCVL